MLANIALLKCTLVKHIELLICEKWTEGSSEAVVKEVGDRLSNSLRGVDSANKRKS